MNKIRVFARRGLFRGLERLDPVAQEGCLLESELRCGFLHFTPQRFDLRIPLVLRHGGSLLSAFLLRALLRGGDAYRLRDLLDDRLRGYAVLEVVRLLDRAAARRFADRRLHRFRHGIRVHYDAAVCVSRGSSDHLDQRRFRTEQPFLIRVEDRNERYLGQVDSLAQQVYSDKHVVYSGAQAAQKLCPLHRFHAVVDVLDLHAARVEIFREILCHLFRKSGDEGALSLLRAAEHLSDEIVHLCRHGAHLDHRIEKSRRADYLLDDLTGAVSLVLRGGRGHRDGLTELLLEFLEEERAVVVCLRHSCRR